MSHILSVTHSSHTLFITLKVSSQKHKRLRKKQTKKMKRATKKAMIGDQKEAPDFISRLPDKVLWFILSLLPIDEAVRSSILSKRWRLLWKHTSHLDFDVKHMIHPLTRLSTSPAAHLDFILNLSKEKGIYRYGILVYLILSQHIGDLTSCRFLHFPQREVEPWVQLLVAKKKGLQDLTLECEPLDTVKKQHFPRSLEGLKPYLSGCIFSSLRSLELINYLLENPSPFEACENLRTLKLKNIHLDDETLNGILKSCMFLKKFSLLESFGFTKIKIRNTNLKFLELNFVCVDEIEVFAESLEVIVFACLICPAENLVIGAPSLRVFHCCSNPQAPILHPSGEVKSILKTQEVLEYCSGLLESKSMGNIFRNLSSLSIDLDLNNIRQALSLSFILRTSVDLQTLRIVIPVNKRAKLSIRSTVAGSFPSPRSIFWEGREICNCVRHKLKFVYIVGFTGKELEVDFVKYLIMRSTKMEMITIVCNSSSMEEASGLLSLQKASANLSIKLKAAEKSPLIELY